MCISKVTKHGAHCSAVIELIAAPDLTQARVNKCLIALVNRKLVQKDSSTVRPVERSNSRLISSTFINRALYSIIGMAFREGTWRNVTALATLHFFSFSTTFECTGGHDLQEHAFFEAISFRNSWTISNEMASD